jgi:DNA replication protein DnaC
LNLPSAAELLAKIPDSYTCAAHGEYATKFADMPYRVRSECPQCQLALDESLEAWRAQWQIRRRWEACGVPIRYRNRTFANWTPQTKLQKKILAAVKAYSAGLDAAYDEGRGLIMVGDVGTGKTHLAAALTHEMVRQGFDCRFVCTGDLFAEIKRGFAKGENEFDIRPLQSVQFLLLDDLGASRGTEWEVSVLHELLRHRYDTTLPTIVTTNCSELDRAVGTRIADRFAENMVRITIAGASQRKQAMKVDGPEGIPAPAKKLVLQICVRGVMEERTADVDHDGLQPLRRGTK